MASRPVSQILLWLFVINLGIAFGARFCEAKTFSTIGSLRLRIPNSTGMPRRHGETTLGYGSGFSLQPYH